MKEKDQKSVTKDMRLSEDEAYSDEQLAGMVLKNSQAFVMLVKRYESRLLGYIRRISGVQIEDAEDILQEAFLDAYRHIADFDASLKFSSWIYRIVHNKTISAYRKRRKQLRDVSIDDEDTGLMHVLAEERGADRETEEALTTDQIKKILESLPERDRTVLVLVYLEEKTYREISDILRVPENTVATWIRRAKQKFQKQYLKEPSTKH